MFTYKSTGVCVMSGCVSKHSEIFLVCLKAALGENLLRNSNEAAFLYTMGCFGSLGLSELGGDAGEVKEEDSIVMQGALAEVEDLLYTFSRFTYLKLVSNSPYLFLHSYLWKKSVLVFYQSFLRRRRCCTR